MRSGARRTKETWRSFEQSRSPVSPSGFNAGHHRIHRVSSKTNQITPATQYFVQLETLQQAGELATQKVRTQTLVQKKQSSYLPVNFCQAVKSLYWSSDRNCFQSEAFLNPDAVNDNDKLSEDVDRGFRYAALNVAALHARFQHNEEATLALKDVTSAESSCTAFINGDINSPYRRPKELETNVIQAL